MEMVMEMEMEMAMVVNLKYSPFHESIVCHRHGQIIQSLDFHLIGGRVHCSLAQTSIYDQ